MLAQSQSGPERVIKVRGASATDAINTWSLYAFVASCVLYFKSRDGTRVIYILYCICISCWQHSCKVLRAKYYGTSSTFVAVLSLMLYVYS